MNTLLQKQPLFPIDLLSIDNEHAVAIMIDHMQKLNAQSISSESGVPFVYMYCTQVENDLLYSTNIDYNLVEKTILHGMELLIQTREQIEYIVPTGDDFLSYILRNYTTSTPRIIVAKCTWLFNRIEPELSEHHWEAMIGTKNVNLFRIFILYSDHPPSCTDVLQRIFGKKEYIIGKELYALKPSYYSYFKKDLFGHSSMSNLFNRMGIENNTAELITTYAKPNDIGTLWDELIQFDKRVKSNKSLIP